MAKILLIMSDGFEELEAVAIIDILRRAQLEVTIAALQDGVVTSAGGVKILPDAVLDDIRPDDFAMVVLPGGAENAENLKKSERVLSILKKFYAEGKYTAAICAAPIALSEAGILKDKKVTGYPSFQSKLNAREVLENERVVVDGKVITSQGPGTAVAFALKIVEIFKGNAVRDNIEKAMLIIN